MVGLVEGGVDVACSANHLALRRGGSARRVRSVQRGSMFASVVGGGGRTRKGKLPKKKGFCNAGCGSGFLGPGLACLLVGWLEWLEPKS